MDPGVTLRVFMIVTGIFLLFITSVSLAKRKMNEPFVLTWGLVSTMLILAGILLKPSGWSRYISVTGMMLICAVGMCVLFGGYFISVRVSELMRKNTELAMQMTLMCREIEELKMEVERQKEGKGETDEMGRYRLKKFPEQTTPEKRKKDAIV